MNVPSRIYFLYTCYICSSSLKQSFILLSALKPLNLEGCNCTKDCTVRYARLYCIAEATFHLPGKNCLLFSTLNKPFISFRKVNLLGFDRFYLHRDTHGRWSWWQTCFSCLKQITCFHPPKMKKYGSPYIEQISPCSDSLFVLQVEICPHRHQSS